MKKKRTTKYHTNKENLIKIKLRSFRRRGQKMSDWSWNRIDDNRCNSLQYNAIHDQFGFQQQLHSPHFTGTFHFNFSILFHSFRNSTSILCHIFSADIESGVHVNHVLSNLLCSRFLIWMLLFFSFSFRFMLVNCHCTMKRSVLKPPNKRLPKRL